METNTTKNNDSKEGTVGFHSLPEEALLMIAGYAAPPDIYNLSLTSKRFHAASPRGGKVLATRLLRASLLSNLDRVLQSTKTGITLEVALELASVNPEGQLPQALIAGSTLAQACLGEVWISNSFRGTDVDVYSSAAAATLVRSWLVEKAGSMFVGFNDYRIDFSDSRLIYTVDTKIHHVEQFGSLEANAARVSDPEEYKRSTKTWGQDCDWYTQMKWTPTMGMGSYYYGAPRGENPDFRVRPKPGGELPFDFQGDGNIDLIVASKKEGTIPQKAGKTAKKKQKANSMMDVLPLEILQDFDLTICKASFDGRTFRIPDPHLSFRRMTTMEPVRKQIVESYLRHLPWIFRLDTAERIVAVSKAITAVKKDLKGLNTPMFHLVDRATDILRNVSGAQLDLNKYDRDAVYDAWIQTTHGSFLQFHNWTAKLVNRLHKYQNRGIEVVGAPVIGDDQVLQEYSMT